MTDMAPDQLLSLILESDKDKQLRICTAAVESSKVANECFASGHVVEIDNLKQHIALLSAAIVDLKSGIPVDPGLLEVARLTANDAIGEPI